MRIGQSISGILEVPNMDYELTLRNTKTGFLIWRSGRREGGSWTANFLKLWRCYFAAASADTATDTGNTSRTLLNPDDYAGGSRNFFAGKGAVNVGTYGIQVGTSATAVTQADYALGTLIATGSGAGQLNYQVGRDSGAPSISSSSFSYTFGRDFSNASGGSITVKEIGLAVVSRYSGDTDGNFLVAHDLTGDVAVGDGQTLAVDYTLSFGTPYIRAWGALLALCISESSATTNPSWVNVNGGYDSNTDVLDASYSLMVPTKQTGNPSNNTMGLISPGSSTTKGIVVGSATTAVAVTDTKLGTLILDGSTSGKLVYQTGSCDAVVTSGSDSWVIVRRSFSNISGGSVAVKEVGIHMDAATAVTISASTVKQFLAFHKLTSSTVTVANLSTVPVDIQIKISL